MDRLLFLFAIENIVSEWLQPYPHIIFRDKSDIVLAFLWVQVPEDKCFEIEKSIQTNGVIPAAPA